MASPLADVKIVLKSAVDESQALDDRHDASAAAIPRSIHMALDDLIKMGDAEIRAAQAQADVANKMADVATKVTQLGVIREEIIKKRLENIAKAFDIQWDRQAHDHLLRIRNQALQKARRHEMESQNARRHADRLGRLLAGDGSWTGIRDAWIAFEFFRGRAPASAAIKMGSVPVEPEAYSAASWRHPEDKQFDDVSESDRDLGRLWHWARTQTLYPRTGSAAWTALAAYLDAMAEAAAARVAELRAETEQLQNDALELAKIDWERLKDEN
jgi:hypothetical protein